MFIINLINGSSHWTFFSFIALHHFLYVVNVIFDFDYESCKFIFMTILLIILNMYIDESQIFQNHIPIYNEYVTWNILHSQ